MTAHIAITHPIRDLSDNWITSCSCGQTWMDTAAAVVRTAAEAHRDEHRPEGDAK